MVVKVLVIVDDGVGSRWLHDGEGPRHCQQRGRVRQDDGGDHPPPPWTHWRLWLEWKKTKVGLF